MNDVIKIRGRFAGTASMFPRLAQISLSSKELYIYIFLCFESIFKSFKFVYVKLIFFYYFYIF